MNPKELAKEMKHVVGSFESRNTITMAPNQYATKDDIKGGSPGGDDSHTMTSSASMSQHYSLVTEKPSLGEILLQPERLARIRYLPIDKKPYAAPTFPEKV
jgi:hypothetical protein